MVSPLAPFRFSSFFEPPLFIGTPVVAVVWDSFPANPKEEVQVGVRLKECWGA